MPVEIRGKQQPGMRPGMQRGMTKPPPKKSPRASAMLARLKRPPTTKATGY